MARGLEWGGKHDCKDDLPSGGFLRWVLFWCSRLGLAALDGLGSELGVCHLGEGGVGVGEGRHPEPAGWVPVRWEGAEELSGCGGFLFRG